MENLIETINGVNYIQLDQYVKVCEELKDVNEEYEKLLTTHKCFDYDDLLEELDELKSQNHDYGVVIATLLYLMGVRDVD